MPYHFNSPLFKFLLCIFLSNGFIFISGFGQNKKVIFFTDKNESPFSLTNPVGYLSERAIARRERYRISIDSTDLPVNPQYVNQIRTLSNLRVLGSSKWLNAIIIECNDAASLQAINNFNFVKKINDVALRISRKENNKGSYYENISRKEIHLSANSRIFSDDLSYGASADQIKIHNGHLLHAIGVKGEGMMIAFLDAGYNQYDNNRFLQSAIKENRIIAAIDFFDNNNNVNDDDHGLLCLSAVAANIPGEYIGTCPKANYLLLRTENAASEQIIEEYMWGLGAEYADSCGVDVLSASVGYTTFDDPLQNHTYYELDGNTTIVTRMADLAAKKGMLVITSAGNEGLSSWKYIGAPGDGDSVFTIGAVDLNKQIAGFSSYGPSFDARIKPDIVSIGLFTALIGTDQSVIYSNGTSFSTPNIAGLMTCLWQLFPDLNNHQIMEVVRKSADRYMMPDERYGNGIPDMAKAVEIILQTKTKTAIKRSDCKAILKWSSYDKKGMAYLVQRKLQGMPDYYTLDTILSYAAEWSNNEYTFTDELILNRAEYRILQLVPVERSKPFVFTLDTLSIEAPSEACRLNTVRLFPNPAKNELNIFLPYQETNGQYTIHISDIQGKKIKTFEWEKIQGGNHSYSIPLNYMSKGIYVIEILHGNKRISSTKFIID
jgi:serine protease AprX